MVPTKVQRRGELSMPESVHSRDTHRIKDVSQKINVSWNYSWLSELERLFQYSELQKNFQMSLVFSLFFHLVLFTQSSQSFNLPSVSCSFLIFFSNMYCSLTWTPRWTFSFWSFLSFHSLYSESLFPVKKNKQFWLFMNPGVSNLL